MTKSAKRFAAAYFLGSCFVMLVGVLMPSSNGPFVVLAKPWGKSAVEVVANAEGTFIAAPSSWIALTDSPDRAFVTRLYTAGAGFVASSTIAYACARLSGQSLEKP